MKAKIQDRQEIAKGVLCVTFDLMGQELNYKAGQFFSLTLLNPPSTDNRGNSRYLGIINSPSEKGIVSILTRIGTSAFKKSLTGFPTGTEVEISGIDGHILLPEDTARPVVFIAGNVGIAPIMSILRYSKEQSWQYTMTLIYVNENKESAPFFDELESYAKDNQKFKFIPVMTNDPQWQGEKRPVDTQFIREYFLNPGENTFFITGDPKFAPPIFKSVREAGAVPPHLTMEIFTGY